MQPYFSIDLEGIVKAINTAAAEVHSRVGPGHMESLYEACLCRELSAKNLSILRLKALPFFYKEQRLDDAQFRNHLIVEDCVLVEISNMDPLPESQILTELQYCKKGTGLVINLSLSDISDAIKRYDISGYAIHEPAGKIN